MRSQQGSDKQSVADRDYGICPRAVCRLAHVAQASIRARREEEALRAQKELLRAEEAAQKQRDQAAKKKVGH